MTARHLLAFETVEQARAYIPVGTWKSFNLTTEVGIAPNGTEIWLRAAKTDLQLRKLQGHRFDRVDVMYNAPSYVRGVLKLLERPS